MQLPLFPLPVCLLPGGYTQLRIFEPRYQRLVAESLKTGSGFVMCMLSDKKDRIMPVGTHAHIIDFETLEDGLLGIKVAGNRRVLIESVTTDEDGLHRGQLTSLPDWPASPLSLEDQTLSHSLKTLMEQHPLHLHQYQDKDFEDISWLCMRWLEIIPVAAEDKQACITSKDHTKALEFIRTLFNE